MSDQPQPMSTPAPAQPPLVARDPDEVLPPRRRRGLRPLTAALAAVVLVGAGFLGGVQIQKHYGGSNSGSASGAAAALASRFRTAGGAAGAAPAAPRASSAPEQEPPARPAARRRSARSA